MQISSAIVFGATGAVGTALVQKLLDKGIKTYAVVRSESNRVDNIPKGAEVVRCSLQQVEQLSSLIHAPVDAFFHLAWAHTIGPGRNDMLAQTENIRHAVLAVRQAAKLGCKVFVGTGSQAEHGRIEGIMRPDSPCNPLNGYGMGKLCAGAMTRYEAQTLGMRHEWARLLSVYGPNDGPMSVIPMIMEKLLNGEEPALTAGEQQWDYLYSTDAAEALIAIAERGKDGAVYAVGGGATRSLREYFCLVRDAVDPALPLGLGEMPYPPGQVMYLQADISALQMDTGFAPKVSFEEGIQLTVQAYKRKRNQS